MTAVSPTEPGKFASPAGTVNPFFSASAVRCLLPKPVHSARSPHAVLAEKDRLVLADAAARVPHPHDRGPRPHPPRAVAPAGADIADHRTRLLIAFSNKAVSRWLIAPLEAAYPPIPELTQSSPVPAELAACRYIVVLGGGHGDMPGLSATNKLSTSGLGRLIEGVRLARALPDATVIFSGPSDGRGETHARVLARAAESLGLAAHRIRLIETAHDTEDEAQAVKAIAGDGKVALVTSAWHMPRAAGLVPQSGRRRAALPGRLPRQTQPRFSLDRLFVGFRFSRPQYVRGTRIHRLFLGLAAGQGLNAAA
jgi:uncharacterized SAM-binding protein YcdF (DUF218 family)